MERKLLWTSRGWKNPIGGPSELACKRFLLALRRNGRFARRGRGHGRRLQTSLPASSQATSSSKLDCRLRFMSSSQLFSNISSEKLMLYFRLVVALYTYTQCWVPESFCIKIFAINCNGHLLKMFNQQLIQKVYNQSPLFGFSSIWYRSYWSCF